LNPESRTPLPFGWWDNSGIQESDQKQIKNMTIIATAPAKSYTASDLAASTRQHRLRMAGVLRMPNPKPQPVALSASFGGDGGTITYNDGTVEAISFNAPRVRATQHTGSTGRHNYEVLFDEEMESGTEHARALLKRRTRRRTRRLLQAELWAEAREVLGSVGSRAIVIN